LAFPNAVQVARVRGIPIRLHLTFLLVLPFFAFVMAQSYFTQGDAFPDAPSLAWGALLAVVLFACVTLHELSHSLVAQRYGITVRSITLLPIGGVSQMEDLPREPGRELRVAAAGPLVNFVIAGPVLAWSFLGHVPDVAPRFGEFVKAVGLVNVALGAFNLLLPAFPMDGGRVLRSLLARRMEFARATHYAAGIGRALAMAMGLVGLLTLGGGGIWLLLIAFFIYMGASEEERAVRVQVTLGGLRVRDLMTPHPVVLRPEQTLEEAFRTMVQTKHVGFPVVGPDGAVVGFLGLQELGAVERAHHTITPVALAMRKDVPMIPPDALATEALRRMGSTGDEHLVVAESGKLAGLLSKTDVSRVVRILAVEQGAEPGDLGV
jgi:Zn-dependent protease/predicted transcriptional regulator